MATDNFGFTTLLGTDTAGYNTINALITSIDTVLKDRVFAADRTWANTAGDGDGPSSDEVMIFTGSFGSGGYWKAGLIAASNIASDAITTAKILDANVTAAKLATDSVTTAKIVDASVTEAKLASNSVTNAKMADNAINTAEIVNSAVTTVKIADDAITNAKLADNSVGVAELQDGSVSQAKLTVGLAQQTLPSGMIAPFAGSTAPAGWVLCNGAVVGRTDPIYSALFDVIDTKYGAGDGSTTFKLPDLQGKIPVGISAEAEFYDLGVTGGVKGVTLTANQSGLRAHTPTGTTGGTNANVTIEAGSGGHTHSIDNASPTHGHSVTLNYLDTNAGSGSNYKLLGRQGIAASGTTTYDTTTNATTHAHTEQTSGAHVHTITQTNHSHTITMNEVPASNAVDSHTNLQPYVVVNYIIKL